MIRKFLIATILSSMCLLIVALHDEQIKFITTTNQDHTIFDQNMDIVQFLSSRKKYNGVMHYSLGARTSSDRIVASGEKNQTYHQPQNVQTTLTYPPSGYGASVTYVAIVVNQTSNLGQAYVTKGGIGQRSIQIVIEAYNTLVFNVAAYIYGN